MQNLFSFILSLLASFLAVAIVLTLHEFSHAFVAYKCGDPTPKWNKRLTLNPLAHFDIFGLVLFAFAGFGWAKPVPIDPNNFRNYKRGLALTAVAGVVANYLSVIVFYPLSLLVFCANLQSICACIRCRFACSTSSRCRRWTVGGSCRRSTAAAARYSVFYSNTAASSCSS